MNCLLFLIGTSCKRGGDLNNTVLRFNDLLRRGIERHVQRIKKNKSGFREPWYNKELVLLEKRRNKFHSLYRLQRSKYYPDFNKPVKSLKTLTGSSTTNI